MQNIVRFYLGAREDYSSASFFNFFAGNFATHVGRFHSGKRSHGSFLSD